MSTSFKDTIDVRPGEELETKPLLNFLHENFTEVQGNEPIEIKQFSAGHSNLTYLLRVGEWEAVLRRPPLGPVAPKAHDMEREYMILSALHPIYPVAPKPFIFSKDEEIVGSPFFLMERRKGIVLDTAFPSNVNYDKELGRNISKMMVDQLVALHDIDYRKTELVKIAKPEGFMERQVYGWINRYERSKTDDISGIDQLTTWLKSTLPDSNDSTIIHYDYKLNNAMFSEDFNEMTGLFDWEMTTVGDPLADLGAALSYWIEADDPELLRRGLGKPPVTIQNGFYTRKEFLTAYAEKSGRDISNIYFYLTFAYFKLAVICQQIYYRYKKGQTNDQRFAHFDTFIANLIEYALQTAKGK